MNSDIFTTSNYTHRNKLTRMSIGDALIALMKDNDYSSIKILDLTKKAGVSRVTFYRYYHSKEEVIEDYLSELVSGYVKLNEGKLRRDFPSYDNVLLGLNYFGQYENFFLAITNAGLYSILINAVNKYMDEFIIPAFHISSYEVYYYAGGLLNAFIIWAENGKKDSAETIALKISETSMH